MLSTYGATKIFAANSKRGVDKFDLRFEGKG